MNIRTEDQITIEFERTIEDIIEFNLFHMKNSPSIRRQALITQVAAAALAVMVSLSTGYLLGIDKKAGTGFLYVLTLVLSIAAFFVVPFLSRAEVINGFRKATKEGDNKAILGNQTISLTPDNIFVKTPAGESKYTWAVIDKIVQNDKYIFLYISSINAIVIPRKAFSTDSSLQEFVDYLNLHREKKKAASKDSE